MMCLGVFLYGSNFFGTLWASRTSWMSISFIRWGKFSFIVCSNKFSISCSSSYPSGIAMIQMLECLEFSHGFLSLSSFFLNCLKWRILFWLHVCLFLLFRIFDLSPGVLPFTLVSLYILLYFTLGSLHLFLHFATWTQSFLRASWLLVSCTLHQIGCLSPYRLVLFLEVWLILSFGPYSFSWHIYYVVRGRALDVCQGRATHVLFCASVWGRGQRGNNAAHLLCSSPTFQKLSFEAGSFSYLRNPCIILHLVLSL